MAKELGKVESVARAGRRSGALQRARDVENHKSIVSRLVDSGRIVRQAYDDFGGNEKVAWMIKEFKESPAADKAYTMISARYPQASKAAVEIMNVGNFVAGEYRRRNAAVQDGTTYVMGPYGDERDRLRDEAGKHFDVIEAVPEGMLRDEVAKGPSGKALEQMRKDNERVASTAVDGLGDDDARQAMQDHFATWPDTHVDDDVREKLEAGEFEGVVIDHVDDEAENDVEAAPGTDLAVYRGPRAAGPRDYTLHVKDNMMLSIDAGQVLAAEQAWKQYCKDNDLEYTSFASACESGELSVEDIERWVSEQVPPGYDAKSYEFAQVNTEGLQAGDIGDVVDDLRGAKLVLSDQDFADAERNRREMEALFAARRDEQIRQSDDATAAGARDNEVAGVSDVEVGEDGRVKDDKDLERQMAKTQAEAIAKYEQALEENPYLTNMNADEIVGNVANKNDDLSKMLMLACTAPLANGMNAKSLMQSMSAFAIMLVLSPKMRETVGSGLKNLDNTAKKAFESKRDKLFRYAQVDGYWGSRQERKEAKINARKLTNSMDRQFAAFANTHKGNMPFVTETAAVTMVKMTENARAAMQANIGNDKEIERINALHADVINKLEERFEKSGLDVAEVRTRARGIVAEKIAEDPQYAAVFAETSNGAMRMTVRNAPQEVSGSVYAHQGWNGGWDVMGKGALRDDAGFFTPRKPMSAQAQPGAADPTANHVTQLATAIATDIGRNATPEGMRDVFVGYLGGFQMRDQDLRMVAGEGTDRDTRVASAMTLQSQLKAMHDDGITNPQQQEAMMREAFANATAYIEQSNPDLFREFQSSYGMDWPEGVSQWQQAHADAVKRGSLDGPVWVGAERHTTKREGTTMVVSQLEHGTATTPMRGRSSVLSDTQMQPADDYVPEGGREGTKERDARQQAHDEFSGKQRSSTRQRSRSKHAQQTRRTRQSQQAQQAQADQVDQANQVAGQQQQQETQSQNPEQSGQQPVSESHAGERVGTTTTGRRRTPRHQRVALQQQQQLIGQDMQPQMDVGTNREDNRGDSAHGAPASGAQFDYEQPDTLQPTADTHEAEAPRPNEYDDPSTPGIIEQKGDSASRGKAHVVESGEINMVHNFTEQIDANDTVADRMARLQSQKKRQAERTRQREAQSKREREADAGMGTK